MKKLLLLCSLLPLSICTYAQHNWLIGYRSGVELIKINQLSGAENVKPLFSNQLFLSKRIIKNLELELNTSYKSSVNNYWAGITFDGPLYSSYNATTHIFETGLTARYFISNSKKITPYLLLGINSVTHLSKTSGFYTEEYTNKPVQVNTKTTQTNILCLYSFGFGINKSIADNWKLNTQLIINYDYPDFTYSYSNQFTPKLQIGLAYCW